MIIWRDVCVMVRFKAAVDAWQQQGLVATWHGPQRSTVGVLRGDDAEGGGAAYTPLPTDVPLYIASAGMRSLAQDMAGKVRFACGSISNAIHECFCAGCWWCMLLRELQKTCQLTTAHV